MNRQVLLSARLFNSSPITNLFSSLDGMVCLYYMVSNILLGLAFQVREQFKIKKYREDLAIINILHDINGVVIGLVEVGLSVNQS